MPMTTLAPGHCQAEGCGDQRTGSLGRPRSGRRGRGTGQRFPDPRTRVNRDFTHSFAP